MWFIWLAVFVILCLTGAIVYLVWHTIWIVTQKNEKKLRDELKAEEKEDE